MTHTSRRGTENTSVSSTAVNMNEETNLYFVSVWLKVYPKMKLSSFGTTFRTGSLGLLEFSFLFQNIFHVQRKDLTHFSVVWNHLSVSEWVNFPFTVECNIIQLYSLLQNNNRKGVVWFIPNGLICFLSP